MAAMAIETWNSQRLERPWKKVRLIVMIIMLIN